jgi:ferritin-like protein
MDILNILNEIEKVDGEIYERLNPRRKAMKDFLNVGKKISLAAMPMALASMFQKAYSQTAVTSPVINSLNLALGLEYMEYELYNYAVANAATMLPAAVVPVITAIRNHEKAHIDLLVKTITALNGTPRIAIPFSEIDYRRGTILPAFGTTVAVNYPIFLRVAMVFEDLGVRAYKGQFEFLRSNNAVLTTAAQIHSVEARHSAQIRQLITEVPIKTPTNLEFVRPWVGFQRNAGGLIDPLVTNDSGTSDFSGAYLNKNENNTNQAGIEFFTSSGKIELMAAISEAFDEPMPKASVITFANGFIKNGTTSSIYRFI